MSENEQQTAEHDALIDALIAKYRQHAQNPSTRYVRAVDVVADLRSLSDRTCTCGWDKPLGPWCPDCGGRTAYRPEVPAATPATTTAPTPDGPQ